MPAIMPAEIKDYGQIFSISKFAMVKLLKVAGLTAMAETDIVIEEKLANFLKEAMRPFMKKLGLTKKQLKQFSA
jgi:hypothetical protein